MTEFKIEPAQVADFEFLLEAIEKYYRYDGIAFASTQIAQGLQLLLSRPELGRAWIVRAKSSAIGYAILGFGFDLEFGGRQATLTDLYLEPAFRGQGLGRQVLATIEQTCQGLGIRAIELQVETDNDEGRRLYEKAGFIAHTRTPMSKRLSV